MLLIALTGGIGSGKSTAAEIFRSKNIPIIDTDVIAKELVEKNKPAYAEIITTFGSSILDENRNIKRNTLREQVFSSAGKRQLLENILHPKIWDEVSAQIKSINSLSEQPPYCIVVVPLLFETSHNTVKFDRVLVIDSDESNQVQRTIKRDHCSENQVKNIMSSQIPRELRNNSADDIILNNDSIEALEKKIKERHQYYLGLTT